MKTMLTLLSSCLALVFNAWSSAKAQGEERFITLSTTTSTQASGLLDLLLPEFQKDTGIRVKVIAKGTGAAIRDGQDGNVDVIFVHAKAREEQFVQQGFGTKRYPVMHNDFVILGPKTDPAHTRGCTHATEALIKIANASALFVSRGDDSGTHSKEQQLWKSTGLKLQTDVSTIIKKGKPTTLRITRPAGKWYLSLGQGMGKALTFADEKRAYILSDRGTFLKYRFGKKPGIELEILCAGDPRLHNPYSLIPVNPAKHPHVKYPLAKSFADWLVSQKIQALIAGYRMHGQQLFYPDAKP